MVHKRVDLFPFLLFVFFFFFSFLFLPPFFLELALSKKIRKRGRDRESIGGRTDGFFFSIFHRKEEKSVGEIDLIFDLRYATKRLGSRFSHERSNGNGTAIIFFQTRCFDFVSISRYSMIYTQMGFLWHTFLYHVHLPNCFLGNFVRCLEYFTSGGILRIVEFEICLLCLCLILTTIPLVFSI